MDFYICRAMEVGRLSREQLERLHEIEAGSPELGTHGLGRCLNSYEIMLIFRIPGVKDFYEIAGRNVEIILQDWADKLRDELIMAKCLPYDEKEHRIKWITSSDVEETHAFDWGVFNRVEGGMLDVKGLITR